MTCLAPSPHVGHIGEVDHRPFALAAVIWFLAVASLRAAPCRGEDLFPLLKARAPEASSAIETAGRALPFSRGKLYKITDTTGRSSYLFATLHLTDPRVTDLSRRVREALAGAKIVALEAIEDGVRLRDSLAKDRDGLRAALLAPADRRADRLLDRRGFAALEALLERRGLNKAAAGQFKAPALALLLDLPSCAIRTDRGRPYADELVGIIARERKIPLVGLETLAEQLTILDGLSREAERDLLLATLGQESRAEDMVETTIARYESGDLGGLLAFMRAAEPLPGTGSVQTPPAFLDRLITARNLRMRDRILPLLTSGGAFIAVGAAHLPGEDGLLRLLERQGYRIEPIE